MPGTLAGTRELRGNGLEVASKLRGKGCCDWLLMSAAVLSKVQQALKPVTLTLRSERNQKG